MPDDPDSTLKVENFPDGSRLMFLRNAVVMVPGWPGLPELLEHLDRKVAVADAWRLVRELKSQSPAG